MIAILDYKLLKFCNRSIVTVSPVSTLSLNLFSGSICIALLYKHHFVPKKWSRRPVSLSILTRFIFSRMDHYSSANNKKLIWLPVDNLPLKCEIECLLIHIYQRKEYKCVYLPLNNKSAALEWKAICEVRICILVCQVILRAAVNTRLPLVSTFQTESKSFYSYSWRSVCLCEYLEAGDCMLTRQALVAGSLHMHCCIDLWEYSLQCNWPVYLH